ncbi:MAG: glycosyltransferase, partial [Rikenellaceae bacterium]
NMFYMRLANGLLLYGKYGRHQLTKHGYPKNKTTVIFNSLDTTAQTALRDRKEDHSFLRNYFADTAPIVIFLGRLTPQKSLHLLIEAIGVLKAQNVACNAIIVGSGSCEQQLRDKAANIGVADRIWFYGDCYDEDMIATLFKSAMVCVSPGNVGLTAMHALSYGVPVITHNRFSEQMPEFEAVHAGKTGDFFKYGDSISLSDKIYSLITKLTDQTKKEECTKECYKIIDTIYNPTVQSQCIEKRILADFR